LVAYFLVLLQVVLDLEPYEYPVVLAMTLAFAEVYWDFLLLSLLLVVQHLWRCPSASPRPSMLEGLFEEVDSVRVAVYFYFHLLMLNSDLQSMPMS